MTSVGHENATHLDPNSAPPAPRPADPQIGPPQPPKDGVMIFFRGRAWPERRYDFFRGRAWPARRYDFFRGRAWPGRRYDFIFAGQPGRDGVMILFSWGRPAATAL